METKKRGVKKPCKENVPTRKNALESDDKMALGRDGVGFFSVRRKVVVTP
jgi:hypothetical protein